MLGVLYSTHGYATRTRTSSWSEAPISICSTQSSMRSRQRGPFAVATLPSLWSAPVGARRQPELLDRAYGGRTGLRTERRIQPGTQGPRRRRSLVRRQQQTDLAPRIRACEGRTSTDAGAVIIALEAAGQLRYMPPYALALVFAGLDDRDAAFAWLERALAVRDVHMVPSDGRSEVGSLLPQRSAVQGVAGPLSVYCRRIMTRTDEVLLESGSSVSAPDAPIRISSHSFRALGRCGGDAHSNRTGPPSRPSFAAVS